MGSSSPPRAPVSPEFLAVFRAEAGATGTMTFARFMELALYHPEVGYYRRERTRVGRGPGTDFYTATSSGPIFGELVVAACVKLLRGREPRAHTFVEIGAEPAGGVLTGVSHPFGAVRLIQVGEPLEITGSCVVFSNELFDAQPFRRRVFRNVRWLETHVRLETDRLVEVEVPSDFNWPGQEDYRFDEPIAAAALAEEIARQPWTGLFVAFDYGKMLDDLAQHTPAGTARAYYHHTQSNDLLAQPGEQDLTCHVCWDWLIEALRANGFSEPALESQEAFFVHHAGEAVAAITAAEAARPSPRKMALMQLLHPANLGQKFQVLHALR